MNKTKNNGNSKEIMGGRTDGPAQQGVEFVSTTKNACRAVMVQGHIMVRIKLKVHSKHCPDSHNDEVVPLPLSNLKTLERSPNTVRFVKTLPIGLINLLTDITK